MKKLLWLVLVSAILIGVAYMAKGLGVHTSILLENVKWVDVGIVAFAIVSFSLFCWVGIYLLTQKNIFFSAIPKGEIKVAVQQDLPRKFFGKIAPGFYIDKDGNPQSGERHVNKKTGEIEPGKASVSILEKLFGIEWIGLPPWSKVRTWKLTFSKWENGENGVDKLVVIKDRDVSSLHVRPTFAFVVKDAETSDKVPLTIEGKYTLSLVNAMSAIYSNKNWIINIDSAIVSAIVDYLRTVSFSDFMAKKIELGNDFLPDIKKINVDGVGNQSIGRYGFMAEDINIMTIAIGGSDKEEITKASTALKVAEDNAKAAKKKAEGVRDAAILEAEGIKALCNALGDNGNQIGLLKIAEALGKQTGPWALGGGMLPTMDLNQKTEKDKKEKK